MIWINNFFLTCDIPDDGKVPIPGQGPATTVSGAPAVKTSGAAKASNGKFNGLSLSCLLFSWFLDATSHPRQFSSAIFPMILLAFLLPIWSSLCVFNEQLQTKDILGTILSFLH